MNTREALKGAYAAGIRIELDGDDLMLEASSPPPAAVLDNLTRHKACIVTLLRPGNDGWLAKDWQVYFDKRAGINRTDGGVPRPEMEAHGFSCCIAEWLNRHPVVSSPDICLGCGKRSSVANLLLPFGIESTGRAWLHSRCWRNWHKSRKEEAIMALMAMGIKKPHNFPNDFGKNGST